MKQFLKRLSLFFIVPVLLLLVHAGTYICHDPFMVLRSYSDYSSSPVFPNRDYVSTEMFLKNRGHHAYNSFIFGSSRTLGFRPSSWVTYLPEGSKPFSFDASQETVYGIYTKLLFLDSMHIPVKNALIVLCRDASFAFDTNQSGHLYMKDPRTGGGSLTAFHLAFYKAYSDRGFFRAYHDLLISKKHRPYMEKYIETRDVVFDTVTNAYSLPGEEEQIRRDPDAYFNGRAGFYALSGERNNAMSTISSRHLFMLREIKRILEKNRTSYKVIISPLYEKVKMNPLDLLILRSVFKGNLYDFSGRNAITENRQNYYEADHFRPLVGDSIFKVIYKR